MKEFVGLIAKTYSQLKDNYHEDKKAKGTKKCVIKRKLKFQDYKDCLKASQIDRKINYLRKTQFHLECFRVDQTEFVKNNKLILKIQQRCKSERHNIVTEEINRIALSLIDNKNM